MRVGSALAKLLLGYALSASAVSIPSAPEDVSKSLHDAENVDLAERSQLSTGHYLRLPTPPTSEIADLPALPTNFSTPLINLTTGLTSAEFFKFRVPHSTIELHVVAAKHIDGQILGNTLLAIHEYLNDEIAAHGDGPLGPKNDPFGWRADGPLRETRETRLASRADVSVALEAQSARGEQMTWSVLLIAVEGLYLCLPAVGRELGAQFEIWDWRDQAQWGFGEVKAAS